MKFNSLIGQATLLTTALLASCGSEHSTAGECSLDLFFTKAEKIGFESVLTYSANSSNCQSYFQSNSGAHSVRVTVNAPVSPGRVSEIGLRKSLVEVLDNVNLTSGSTAKDLVYNENPHQLPWEDVDTNVFVIVILPENSNAQSYPTSIRISYFKKK